MRRPSAEILQQLARALEVSSETIYVRAGILDPEARASTVIEAVRRDPELTEQQKSTLIHVYESFRSELPAPAGPSEPGPGGTGPTATQLLDFANPSSALQALETANPLGRIGRPAEIAAAVLFLAGPGATFITGQCIGVDGGAAMK